MRIEAVMLKQMFKCVFCKISTGLSQSQGGSATVRIHINMSKGVVSPIVLDDGRDAKGFSGPGDASTAYVHVSAFHSKGGSASVRAHRSTFRCRYLAAQLQMCSRLTGHGGFAASAHVRTSR